MKTPGRSWSRTNILTVIGAVAGLLVIPVVAILVPGEFASSGQDFSRASVDDLDPQTPTCLADSTQIIPAGVTVCARLAGHWLDGSGPLGVHDHEATAIWTRQAHPPFMVLTSPLAYQHGVVFREATDFVVCVQPPQGAERAREVADRMSIDVARSSSTSCAMVEARP